MHTVYIHLKKSQVESSSPIQKKLQVIYIYINLLQLPTFPFKTTFHPFFPLPVLFSPQFQTSANGSGRQNGYGIQCDEGQNLSSSVGAKSLKEKVPPPTW